MHRRRVERDGHAIVTIEAIEIVALDDREPLQRLDAGTWPCPACGVRRPRDRGRHVVIKNRAGPPFERPAVLCHPCVEQALSRSPSDNGRVGADAEFTADV